jgi:uncharacterized protein (TIGR00299 family) protein
VDAGVALADLRAGLGTLPLGGWSLDAEPVVRHGLSGTHVQVRVTTADQPHRGLSTVHEIIAGGDLPAPVVARAQAVFTRLGEVEAAIHSTSVEAVEFHEVGAIDSIIDLVGVVLGLHLLEVDWARVACSPLPLGSGWVRAAHGRLPVPAPATAELMRLGGAPLRPDPGPSPTGELTTPSAAALLTVLATFETGPAALGEIAQIGYGFGTREPDWPNAVRLLVGAAEPAQASALRRETVVELQTNLDDATPEELGFAMERLFEAGALDVAFSPLQMKKNRPGVLLRVLGRPADGERLAELVLVHTSALGVRVQPLERVVAGRATAAVQTPWGEVRVKYKLLGERRIAAAPEYEDCARVARAAGVPLREVYAAAQALSLRR